MINKNISIIKNSSLVIMILSVLGAISSVSAGVWYYNNTKSCENMKNILAKNIVSYCLYAAILILAALIFFRIFRSGRPFTRGNVWAVRGIAGVFLVKAMLPTFFQLSELWILKTGVMGTGSIFIAVLFLFFAEIMRYGSLLQTESDETL